MYTIHDTFNNQIVSSHRTLLAAVKAKAKFNRAVSRNNGTGSYIPTVISHKGQPVPEHELHTAERDAGF